METELCFICLKSISGGTYTNTKIDNEEKRIHFCSSECLNIHEKEK